MSKLKKMLIGLIFVVLFGGLYFVIKIEPIIRSHKNVLSIEIKNTDINNIEDGIYIGDFKYHKSYIKTEISIKNGKITKIEILENAKGSHEKDVEQNLVPRVIKKQRTDVDVISGATVSSKALLQSLNNGFIYGVVSED